MTEKMPNAVATGFTRNSERWMLGQLSTELRKANIGRREKEKD